MSHPLTDAQWLNPTRTCTINSTDIRIDTEPHTDFWQRTFYGFQAANAPAALIETRTNVTFTVRVRAEYKRRYDQAGILVWLDDQNWFKASVEREDESSGRLGSVLTTNGHSDWATRDVPALSQVCFRLSRRGPDFVLEAKSTQEWEQLRVFHIAELGPTDSQWAALKAEAVPASPVRLGVYACSPEDSSFTARFDQLTLTPSVWSPHE